MSHETARQRYRRHKADPYRAAVLAPAIPAEPVVCVDCGHARLLHATDPRLGCLVDGCDLCTEYREVTT